jgi:O-antigen/teichoic acid export membrane protein
VKLRRLGWSGTRPRSEEATLVSSSAALVVSRIAVAAMGWAGTVLIVRSLSTGDWGRFSFIFGFLGILSVITDLGVGRIALAGLLDQQSDRRRAAGTYVLLRALLGVVGYLVAVGVVVVAGYPQSLVRGMLVAGLILVLAAPSNGLEAVFQASFRLRSVAAAHALAQLAQLALTCAIAVAGGSLILFILPAVLFEVVDIGYKLYRIPVDLRPRPVVDWPAYGRLLKEAAPLAVGGILTVAFYRIDLVMLSKLDTFEAVGVYGIAYKFGDILHFASSSLMLALLPLMVRAWPTALPAFHRAFRRAFLLSALVGALAVVEFGLFARPFISLLYGERYGEAASATKLVVAGEFLHFFTRLALTALIATGRHRHYPAVTLAGVAVNIGLNLWMIPAYSYNGAALATLITESLVALGMLAVALRLPATRPLPLAGAASCLLAAVPAGLVGFAAERLVGWPVGAVATGTVFLAAAHLLRIAGPGGLAALMRDDPSPVGPAGPAEKATPP